MRIGEIPPCNGENADRADQLVKRMLDLEVETPYQIRRWFTDIKYLPAACRKKVWHDLRVQKENYRFNREIYEDLRKAYISFMYEVKR
jgi:hypothetical protein